jgi:hypothetical protein
MGWIGRGAVGEKWQRSEPRICSARLRELVALATSLGLDEATGVPSKTTFYSQSRGLN